MEASSDFFNRKHKDHGVALNHVQKQAVLQTEGPLLLLAAPGSGKTTTMIMRIGYLIEVKGVAPSRIKAVTFSRASASDMKERFTRFFPDLPPVDFSTLHSLAFEIVREHFRQTGTAYQMIEGDIELEERVDFDSEHPPLHKKHILRHLFNTIVGEIITDDQMDELTTYISYIKNKMIPREEWPLVECDVKEAERILREYEAFKRSGSDKLLIDYDDMLTLGNEILERDKVLLRKYQQRYDYVLTDESQDTSLVQHAIIEKLVRRHGNLCVVADDDQSIYGWRGAEPSYLLNFKQVYPKAVILFMEQNYRSSKDIVSAANQFIKRNKSRYDKNMFTHNPSHQPIKIRSLADYQDQAKYLVQEIQKVESLRDVAVLYRNNASSIPLMNEFDRAGIPFYMKDGDIRFFSHWVVKDILNFMRMTFTDKRADILEEIHTKINGYITRRQMAALKEITNNESVFDNLLNYVELKDYQRKPLQECKETLQQMKGIPPLDAIRSIRRKLGYEKAVEKMSERLGFRKEYVFGILNTLEEIADGLETMEDFAKRLKYLESVMKSSRFNKNRNAVTFSTLHSAKGLEFKRVYMIDLIDGIIPSNDDLEKNGAGKQEFMEEAVRLFYVGMTRAKMELKLITYQKRDGEKVKESLFVSDVRSIIAPPKPMQTQVPKEEPSKPHNPKAIRNKNELKLGSIVEHRVFGRGEIIKINGERIHIRFQAGVKALSILTCIEAGLLEPAVRVEATSGENGYPV
ncbi:ATP-dependent helicase [Paenibacillus naphthalenovorans]|uniref:DNA 3'-5' helicase n=1 Tax=Paenibacillus naphthalenovorans TaxID=162209 RepID=A0A0U2L238_9BACL|nr:ATP-dependent helicase [Paenibacillus naphthalenovorans]ALS23714.1 ATP-dependent DNA helicase UvrD [Paenibacillus naphthalenovorans]